MVRSTAKRRCGGFTLLELVVVTSAVALLSGVLLHRVTLYQELAERAAMQQTVSAIRSSLYLQALNLIAKGRQEEIAALAERNPIEALAEKPANYGGDWLPHRQGVVSGQWYFDSTGKKLLYLVHNGRNFRTESRVNAIQYRVRIVRGAAEEGQPQSPVEGVLFEPAHPYTWFN